MTVSTAVGTYRKCFNCGTTTTDFEKTHCECGGYMHMISQLYGPMVKLAYGSQTTQSKKEHKK